MSGAHHLSHSQAAAEVDEPTAQITGVSLGERIKAAWKQIGLSQAELAEKVSIANSTMQQYESGQYQPGLDIALRIAKKLGVPVYDLAGEFARE